MSLHRKGALLAALVAIIFVALEVGLDLQFGVAGVS